MNEEKHLSSVGISAAQKPSPSLADEPANRQADHDADCPALWWPCPNPCECPAAIIQRVTEAFRADIQNIMRQR